MILALTVTQEELAELEDAHERSLGAAPGGDPGPRPDADDRRRDRPGGGSAAGEGAGPGTQARRSLAARGLLTEAGSLAAALDEDDDDALALVVRTTLDVRSAAPRTIVVDRLVATHDHGRTEHGLRLVHVLGDVACVEDVTGAGVHHLWLVLDLREVPLAVAGVMVPEHAVAGAGPPRRVPIGPAEALLDLLDGPTVVATLSVVTDGPPDGTGGRASTQEHLLALGPRGCWIARPEEAPPPQPAAGAVLVFRPVSPAWVEDQVRRLLAHGQPAPGPGDPVAGSSAVGGRAWQEVAREVAREVAAEVAREEGTMTG